MNKMQTSAPQDEVVVSGGAGELISAGAQIVQVRTKHQLMVAVQRPRDDEKFSMKLKAEAAAAGEDFFYSIPFKDHKPNCQDRRRCNCPVELVEGPGVGLARSAVRLWGNCSVDTMPEHEAVDHWLVGAYFIDFETNFTKHETKRISKIVTLKGGRTAVAKDKQLDLEYQKGASKVERDVILHAMPRHVIEQAFEIAKAAALQEKKPMKEQIARVIRRFSEMDVSLQMIEDYIGCAFTEEAMKKAELDPRERVAHLRGLITALRGGDATITEVFGEPEKAQTSATGATGVEGEMTASDLATSTSKLKLTHMNHYVDVNEGFKALGYTTEKQNELLAQYDGNLKAVYEHLQKEANVEASKEGQQRLV